MNEIKKVMIKIIPVAHVSRASVEEVKNEIEKAEAGVIAVELCERRFRSLRGDVEKTSLYDIIKHGNATLFILNSVLATFQRQIGEQFGIMPGKEMLTAIELAESRNMPVALIDRDIRITLSRAIGISFVDKLRIVKSIFASLIFSGEEEIDIEEMKKEENIGMILNELKESFPSLYKILVDERDAYMARKLIELEKLYGSVIAVVGAGHKPGIEHYLKNPDKIPDFEELTKVKKSRVSKLIKYSFPVFIILLFILAFSHGFGIGKAAILWILYNAVPTFIAVLIAGGSIYSAIAGMLASPITSLFPFIAAGWVAAIVELRVRKAGKEDFKALLKANSYRELLNNKAFRVILVGAFANIGSSIGTLAFIPRVLLPIIRGG